MKFTRTTVTAAALLLFGTMVPVYAQHDEKSDKPGAESKAQAPKQQEARPAQPQARPVQTQARPAPQAQPQHAQQTQAPKPQPQQAQPQRAQQAPQQQRNPQAQQTPQKQPAQQHAQTAPQQPARAQSKPVTQAAQQPQRTQQQAQSWQQQKGWEQGGGWQPQPSWQQDRATHWSSDHRTWAQRGGYGGAYVSQASFGLYFGMQHLFRIQTPPVMYLGYPRFAYGGYSFLMVDPYPEYWADNWYYNDDLYIDYDGGYYLHDRSYPQVRLAIMIAL